MDWLSPTLNGAVTGAFRITCERPVNPAQVNPLYGWSGIVLNMEIANLRSRWSDILDQLEKDDRIAWLVFFDARLDRLDGRTLILDYSDSRKFPGNFEYGNVRESHRAALQGAIRKILSIDLEVADGP